MQYEVTDYEWVSLADAPEQAWRRAACRRPGRAQQHLSSLELRRTLVPESFGPYTTCCNRFSGNSMHDDAMRRVLRTTDPPARLRARLPPCPPRGFGLY